MNAAASSDTVFVRSGTYYEHVTIGKSLTLQGEDRDSTIIDGSGSGNVLYITANYVTVSGVKVTDGENGIVLIANYAIHHITIRDVIITSNDQIGIRAGHSNSSGAYHVIEDCIISNNGSWGLYAHQFSRSIIRNCEVYGNAGGLDPAWGFDTLVANNEVHHNDYDGIHLDAMRTTTVEKNNVYSNVRGISVGYVNGYNTIRDNIVRNNTIGIHTDTWTGGNKIYHNDLIDNTHQAYDLHLDWESIWDNGYPSGGNYWSDYTGLDLYSGTNQDEPGSDGIGDTPYVFDYRKDNYPLMSPWNISYNTPVGTNVSVVATDPDTGEPSPVVITFLEVTTAGDTTVETSSTGPFLPNTFMLGQPPTFFDITTTATYEGTVTVCIDYSAITFDKPESELQLLQKTNGWEDITVSIDTDDNIICGDSTSLSWFTVVQPNYPPTADAGGPYSVNEGNTAPVTATGSDPEEEGPVSFAWDLDSDGTFETPAQSVIFSASTLDGPSSHIITVQVTDSTGLATTDQATVDVLNVAPTVGAISAPTDPIEVGAAISASADFTDPGTLDTHTAVWDWGDDTSSAGSVTETDGSGSVSDNHTYTGAGVYTVRLTMTDKDGGSGESIFQYVVVYDPSAGFVTGGGWIDSPEGAYTPGPSLTGKASFGFVSKYKKGTDVPFGETEFQFRVADLNFHSTSYQWMVIAGAKAIFKGEGTINGEGNYGFMLSAIDADVNQNDTHAVDRFRVKIWDIDDGDAVVYDNQMEAADDADPATEIRGGSIVIHKK